MVFSQKVKRHHLFKGINLSETKKKELKARVEEIKKDLRQQIENKKNTEIVELKKAFVSNVILMIGADYFIYT
jgi:F0F1-type ATP synthase membrane subunit b/b'